MPGKFGAIVILSNMPSRGGELEFIEALKRRVHAGGNKHVSLGIGDDCAVLQSRPNEALLVTTDFSLENRHFRRDWHSGQSAGHRCAARGLSDLSAMGATPLACFLSLAVPPGMRRTAIGRRWLYGFLDGLTALCTRSGATLAGGDTSESPTDLVLADIVAVGSARTGTELRRSGARPGDSIFITGSLGGAAAELKIIAAKGRVPQRSVAGDGRHPHLFPEPRLAVGGWLRKHRVATAAIDVSDGISTDLLHLCKASGVGAILRRSSLPLHPLAVRSGAEDGMQMALHGGEDYELLFTVPPGRHMPHTIAGIEITQIGKIVKSSRHTVWITDDDDGKRLLERGGWEHKL